MSFEILRFQSSRRPLFQVAQFRPQFGNRSVIPVQFDEKLFVHLCVVLAFVTRRHSFSGTCDIERAMLFVLNLMIVLAFDCKAWYNRTKPHDLIERWNLDLPLNTFFTFSVLRYS